jgi:hypothetical protein
MLHLISSFLDQLSFQCFKNGTPSPHSLPNQNKRKRNESETAAVQQTSANLELVRHVDLSTPLPLERGSRARLGQAEDGHGGQSNVLRNYKGNEKLIGGEGNSVTASAAAADQLFIRSLRPLGPSLQRRRPRAPRSPARRAQELRLVCQHRRPGAGSARGVLRGRGGAAQAPQNAAQVCVRALEAQGAVRDEDLLLGAEAGRGHGEH